jgi:hypothetical protein
MKTIDSECQLFVGDVHFLFPNEYFPGARCQSPPCAKFSDGFGAGGLHHKSYRLHHLRLTSTPPLRQVFIERRHLAHPPFRDRTAEAVHRDRQPVAAVLLPRRRGGSIHRWATRRPAAAPGSERGSRPTHRLHDGVETTKPDGGIPVRQRAPSIDIGTGSQIGAGPAAIALP